MRNAPGYLISLEGPEGCGKTTHTPFLVEYVRSLTSTKSVFSSREPGGTSISEQIRDLTHDLRNAEMHARTETLLYQAARAQIVEQVIKPRLKDGEIVVLDRFFDSTIAYQGYGHQQDLGVIRPIVRYATDGIVPDFTVLLDVDTEIGLSRKKSQEEWNRMDAYEIEFHKRVRSGYLEMAKKEPDRFIIVDASKAIEEVFVSLKEVVENKLRCESIIEGSRNWGERRI